jgi:hypothetical protein
MNATVSADSVTRNYTAYGLAIRSAIPLSEFTAASSAQPEVIVTYGHRGAWVAEMQGAARAIEIREGEARFWFPDVGAFIVRDGSQIIAIPEDGVEPELLRLYIQGMMMATILHQRGFCVLHASVIEIDGGAIALMGHIGAGKSSLAGALYVRGHRVVADDNAAVNTTGRVPIVAPGYPYVKLFPAIASLLGFQEDSLCLVHASQVKLRGAVTQGFAHNPLPLRRVYILDREHSGDISPLSPLKVTIELLRNSVPTRWGHAGDARQLQQCGMIGMQVPAFAVKTFSDLTSVQTVAERLERHCGQFGSPAVSLSLRG